MGTDALWIVLIGFAGWIAGIWVNYLSDVLPARRRLVRPFCVHCQQPMGWWQYLVWPRRCVQCNQIRPWRSWVIELVFMVSSLWIWLVPPERLGFLIGLAWLIYFGVIVVIDIENHLILHPVSWVGAGLGLATGVWLHGWKSTLLGGAAGFGIMLVIYWIGILYVRAIARRRGKTVEEGDAFGYGDVNLSGVIGLLLGWPGILAGLVFSILLAGAVTLIYLVGLLVTKRYTPNMAVPYGPFLAASAIYLLYLR